MAGDVIVIKTDNKISDVTSCFVQSEWILFTCFDSLSRCAIHVAVVLMGKNTMMRKAIRGHLENNPALEK